MSKASLTGPEEEYASPELSLEVVLLHIICVPGEGVPLVFVSVGDSSQSRRIRFEIVSHPVRSIVAVHCCTNQPVQTTAAKKTTENIWRADTRGCGSLLF